MIGHVESLYAGEVGFPNVPPKMIVICGPCRVGTTALANVFARAGIISHMQPIKSARRAKEIGRPIVPWKIEGTEGEFILCKETVGVKTEGEFFDPIEILLSLGYPAEKLIFIPIVRDPRKTLASWREMWKKLDIGSFSRTYDLTLKSARHSESVGVKTISYVHEAIRDQDPNSVVQKLFQAIGLPETFGGELIDWAHGPRFGEGDPATSALRFYDVPPDKFVKEVKGWGAYGYKEEPYLKLSPDDVAFLKSDITAEHVYEEMRQSCQKPLSVEVKPFSDVDYWG